jgi:hypothetical protein
MRARLQPRRREDPGALTDAASAAAPGDGHESHNRESDETRPHPLSMHELP